MTEVAQAYVRLRPNATGFEREAEAQVAGVGSKLGGVFALAFGAAAGVELGKVAVEAAVKQQQAISQVMQLTRQAGAANEAYGKSIKENLVDLADESGFTVEELAQAFARLQPGVKNTAKALDLLTTATETARGSGRDLTAVSTAVAKAQAGSATALARIGVQTKAYTQAQDEVKARLNEVARAEEALRESRDQRYSGTIKLSEAEQRIAAMTDAQRVQLVQGLKAQLDSAKATDKQTTAQKALAELQTRYAGQNPIFAATAEGQLARFHEAVNELEVTIGDALLPTLSRAAAEGREWIQSLADSPDVAAAVQGAAEGIASGIDSIINAIQAAQAPLRLLAGVAEEIGAGPVLAAVAAYKALTLAQSAAVVLEARWGKLVETGSKAQSARVATLEAEAVAARQAVAAEEARLAVIAETNPFLTARQVAIVANMDALYAETVALLENTAAQEANAIATGESVVASNALTASLARQGVADAAVAAEKGLSSLALAGRGLLGIMTGPTGIIAGLAIAAGALYYFSTRESETQQHVDDLTDALERQTKAGQDAAKARDQAQTDTNALPLLRDQRTEALKGIEDAQNAYDTLALSGHSTRAALAKDADAIAIAQAHWRDTNREVLRTEKDKSDQLKASAQFTRDGAKAAREAADEATRLIQDVPLRNGEPFNFKPNPNAIREVEEAYRRLNKAADDSSLHITEKQRAQLRELADWIEEHRRRPTQVEIDLILNTKTAEAQLAGFKGSLLDDPALRNAGLAAPPGARGDHSQTVIATTRRKQLKDEAKKDANAYTTSFVQTIDAGAIAEALTSAIASAQSNLSSQASGLAGAIGDQLDERLRRSVASLDAQSKALQDRISQREAAATARSTQLGSQDAALKLKQLQSVLGTGALTADQQLQLQAAKNAVLDANDAIANASDQNALTALSARKDALQQANDLEKTAANRRISDLTDELNRGLISQATYVKGVRGLLAKEDVSYKSAGKLLGKAFADGFADSLSSVLSQVKALGLVGQAQLKAAPKGTRAVSPLGEEAKAIQAFIDQVAGSGGRFNVTNADKLPAGVNLPALLSAAGQQRAETAYREKSSRKQDDVIHYTGQTADHTAQILAELRKAAKPTVVVINQDGSKRKVAQATR